MVQWKKAFPDPFNSPAQYTGILSIHGIPVLITGVGGWVSAFHNVVHIHLESLDQASLIPLYSLSPAVSFPFSRI